MDNYIVLETVSDESLQNLYDEVKGIIHYDNFISICNILTNCNTETVTVTYSSNTMSEQVKTIIIVNKLGKLGSHVSFNCCNQHCNIMQCDNLVLKGKARGMVTNNGKTQFFTSDNTSSKITVEKPTTTRQKTSTTMKVMKVMKVMKCLGGITLLYCIYHCLTHHSS